MWGHLCTELSNLYNFNVGFSTHKSEILIHLSQWQYWWWFWFSFFWTFYFFVILRVIKHRVFKMNLKINTSFRSRGKWGDYLVTLIPLSWCLNILLNSNFILRMIEWQSEAGSLIIRIHGKQWYWVYKYDLQNVSSIAITPKNIGHAKWFSNFKEGDSLYNTYLNQAELKIAHISNNEYWTDALLKDYNKTSTFTITNLQSNKVANISELNKTPLKQQKINNTKLENIFMQQSLKNGLSDATMLDNYSAQNKVNSNYLKANIEVIKPKKPVKLSSDFMQKSIKTELCDSTSLDIYLTPKKKFKNPLNITDKFKVFKQKKLNNKLLNIIQHKIRIYKKTTNIDNSTTKYKLFTTNNCTNILVQLKQNNKYIQTLNLLPFSEKYNIIKFKQNKFNTLGTLEKTKNIKTLNKINLNKIKSKLNFKKTPELNTALETPKKKKTRSINDILLMIIASEKNNNATVWSNLYKLFMNCKTQNNSSYVRTTALKFNIFTTWKIKSSYNKITTQLWDKIKNSNPYSIISSKYVPVIREITKKSNPNLQKINFFSPKKQTNKNQYFKLIKNLTPYTVIEKHKNKKILQINFFENYETKKNKLSKTTLSFYDNNAVDDSWEAYSNVRLFNTNVPTRIVQTPLNNHNLNNKNLKLYTWRFLENNTTIAPKPSENIEFLVVKQKRYKRKQGFKHLVATQNDSTTYSTNRFLKNNLIFKQIAATNTNNAFNFYVATKLNRNRSETFSINLARRLLRTTRTLVLPAYTNISIIANSYDVVHSWFIPGLGIKMDCVPGKSTHHSLYIDNVGLYYGQCAEICGRYHHHMPIRICAIPFDHFIVWWVSKGLPKILKTRYNPKKVDSGMLFKYTW